MLARERLARNGSTFGKSPQFSPPDRKMQPTAERPCAKRQSVLVIMFSGPTFIARCTCFLCDAGGCHLLSAIINLLQAGTNQLDSARKSIRPIPSSGESRRRAIVGQAASRDRDLLTKLAYQWPAKDEALQAVRLFGRREAACSTHCTSRAGRRSRSQACRRERQDAGPGRL
jgi:hypothetical protein